MTSYFSLSPKGTKFTALALACTVLVGLSGCNNQSVLSEGATTSSSTTEQQDPDWIHANHAKGVDPDGGDKDYKSREEFRKRVALLNKWGVKQTSDWLAICNQVNVPAMRKVGFDPQKDLQNRKGGAGKNNCYWMKPKNELSLLFGKTDDVDRVRNEPDFHYTTTVKRDGHTYYLGHIEYVGEGTFVRTFSCSVTFERAGVAYMASFIGRASKTQDEACNELIDMMSPRK